MNIEALLDKLSVAGSVVAFGYADKLAKGGLASLFSRVNPTAARDFIDHDRSMWQEFTEERWDKLRLITKAIDVESIVSMEKILESIKRSNPEFSFIVRFHPGGMEWLEKQRRCLLENIRSEEGEVPSWKKL